MPKAAREGVVGILGVLALAGTTHADTFGPLSPGGTPPSARIGHSALADAANGRMVVFGGGTIQLAQIPSFTPLDDVHVLDLAPGAESWASLPLPARPPVRMFHAAIYDAARSRMLVHGGLDPGYFALGDLWELTLSPGSEAWRAMAPTGSAPARFGHSAIYVPSLDAMVVYGGYASLFTPPTGDLHVLSLGTGDGTWSQEPNGGGPASGGHQMTVDPGPPARLLMFGIGDIVGQLSDDALWARDLPLAASSWVRLQPPAPLPTPRQGFPAVAIPSSTPTQWLVLGGGLLDLATTDRGDYLGSAAILDASPGAESWRALVPDQSIARVAMWTAVHDAAGSRVVLFGGRDGNGDSNATYALTLGTTYERRLASATPARGDAGQSLNVTLSGAGTSWVQGSSFASFGPEVAVNRLTVLTPDLAVANVTIASGALEGPRDVGVVTGSVADTAIGVFTVDARQRSILVGAGLADPNPNRALVYDALGRPQETDITAYGAGRWGLNVGAGDLAGSGTDLVLTGPGPGGQFGPQVRAFDSAGDAIAKVNFFAYGSLRYGCGVASGATDADRFDEIVTGAGAGAVFGPHVRGFDYDATAVAANPKVNFFAYGTLKFGVKGVVPDIDRDGYDEIATAPGPGVIFPPQVRAFGVDGGTAKALPVNFFAFPTGTYGANVAGGDVDADAAAELLVARGPGAVAPHDSDVQGFDVDGPVAAIPGLAFTAFPASQLYGARVGAGSYFLEEGDEIVVGGGPDPTATGDVRQHGYDATAGASTYLGHISSFPGLAYGVNVVTAGLGF